MSGGVPMESFNIGGGAPADMARALQVVNDAPDIYVSEVQGDPSAPSLVVVSMTPDRAGRLRQELGGALIVEPNVPMEPYGG